MCSSDLRLTIRRHGLAGPATRVAVAVSGGSDSVALAHLLRALDRAGELRVVGVAHFNHQLRADAEAEQILFEMHGLILSLHHDARFMRIPGALTRAGAGFDRTIQFYATPAGLEIEQRRKASKTSAVKR